jgi:hypothetical protein
MGKYGIITDDSLIVNSEEVTWSFQRKEEDESISNYKGIEFVNRSDMSKIQVIGTAQDFITWLNEFGAVESEII